MRERHQLASWEMVAGSGSRITLSPRPLPSSVANGIHEHKELGTRHQFVFGLSWKRFLKKTFALLVGYDKKEEINLTKEKTKWDLIYTH